MNKTKQYILNELKTIEKECMEEGITASEWIERYAKGYRGKYGKDSMQTIGLAKKNSENKSRWANWLDWVNNK